MSRGSACKRRLKHRVQCTPVLMLVAMVLYQKVLWDESTPLRLLPVSSIMLERSWQQHKHGGDQGEVSVEKRQCRLQRSRRRDGLMRRQNGKRIGGPFFVLYPDRGLGTLGTPMHLLWRDLPIPKAMSKWLAKGWKRQVTIQIIPHPSSFYGHQSSGDDEMKSSCRVL